MKSSVIKRVENLEMKIGTSGEFPEWVIKVAEQQVKPIFSRESSLAFHKAAIKSGVNLGEFKEDPHEGKSVLQRAKELMTEFSSFKEYEEYRQKKDYENLIKLKKIINGEKLS
jgi:hypothetical protein